MTDYPSGDGHPDCPTCRGRGAIDYKPPGAIVPGVLICKCVRKRDARINMERGWLGLSKAVPLKDTFLLDAQQNLPEGSLWITATTEVLRRHMAHIGYVLPNWRFQVSTDSDLMDAWLSRIDKSEILDPDVERIRQKRVSNRWSALVDLIEPPELLVLCISVKAARNSAMPEVLLEALQLREHLDKPTWVVDTPQKPFDLGHIAYSDKAQKRIGQWPHVTLTEIEETSAPDMPEWQSSTGEPEKEGSAQEASTPPSLQAPDSLVSAPEPSAPIKSTGKGKGKGKNKAEANSHSSSTTARMEVLPLGGTGK